MKSTIKIDYDRSHELKPVIKIILPLDLREGEMCTEAHDIDPRDKLVADFLHTPRNIVENYLFEVNQRVLINNGTHLLTTIGAIPEEEIFTRFQTAIMGRIIGDDINNLRECHLFRKNKKSTIPCPKNYDKWLKITEFFEWLNDQPYHNDTSDNIDDHHEIIGKYAGTIRHYFEMCLSDDERQNAFDNTSRDKWDTPVKDAYHALDIAFDFKTSPQGLDYWNRIIDRLKQVPEII